MATRSTVGRWIAFPVAFAFLFIGWTSFVLAIALGCTALAAVCIYLGVHYDRSVSGRSVSN